MPAFDPDKYVDVQERIVRFWSEHPDGALLTELMSPPDDFTTCRYKAIVFKHREDKTPSATGYAFEIAGGSGANRTSHEENCETSAIGRALANMGYATTRENRPSRQEMSKTVDSPVTRQEPRRDAQLPNTVVADPPVNQAGIAALHAKANKRNLSHEDIHAVVVAYYNIESVKQLTGRMLNEVMRHLDGEDQDIAEWVLTARDKLSSTQGALNIPGNRTAESFR